MNRLGWIPVAVLAFTAGLGGEEGIHANSLDIVMEHKAESGWHSVDPHYVFASGDRIRFVFRSGVPGYLYVLNRAPSGASEWIFPAANTHADNQVATGQTYAIPADGAFVISGPPGFETTVWILSPKRLATATAKALSAEDKSAGSSEDDLIPRCRDTFLIPRGPCTDDRAGATPFRVTAQPDSLVARELSFAKDGDSTRITPRDDSAGNPIVYEFRIAHR
jgi:hypothetical protein